ncbi:MAG: hypothetical protein Q9216_006226 [Gyalolechia sp. 2 TL-2023]
MTPGAQGTSRLRGDSDIFFATSSLPSWRLGRSLPAELKNARLNSKTSGGKREEGDFCQHETGFCEKLYRTSRVSPPFQPRSVRAQGSGEPKKADAIVQHDIGSPPSMPLPQTSNRQGDTKNITGSKRISILPRRDLSVQQRKSPVPPNLTATLEGVAACRGQCNSGTVKGVRVFHSNRESVPPLRILRRRVSLLATVRTSMESPRVFHSNGETLPLLQILRRRVSVKSLRVFHSNKETLPPLGILRQQERDKARWRLAKRDKMMFRAESTSPLTNCRGKQRQFNASVKSAKTPQNPMARGVAACRGELERAREFSTPTERLSRPSKSYGNIRRSLPISTVRGRNLRRRALRLQTRQRKKMFPGNDETGIGAAQYDRNSAVGRKAMAFIVVVCLESSSFTLSLTISGEDILLNQLRLGASDVGSGKDMLLNQLRSAASDQGRHKVSGGASAQSKPSRSFVTSIALLTSLPDFATSEIKLVKHLNDKSSDQGRHDVSRETSAGSTHRQQQHHHHNGRLSTLPAEPSPPILAEFRTPPGTIFPESHPTGVRLAARRSQPHLPSDSSKEDQRGAHSIFSPQTQRLGQCWKMEYLAKKSTR